MTESETVVPVSVVAVNVARMVDSGSRQAAANASSKSAGTRSASTARMQSPAGVSQSSLVTSNVLVCAAETCS